jgi:hypothetical protein
MWVPPPQKVCGLYPSWFCKANVGVSKYGGADNAADWVSLAQFVNYEGYRAMFEAQGKNRMGRPIRMRAYSSDTETSV